LPPEGAWIDRELILVCTGAGRHSREPLKTVRFGLRADGQAVLAFMDGRRRYRCRASIGPAECGRIIALPADQHGRHGPAGPSWLIRLTTALAAANPDTLTVEHDISTRIH
jgi:hypothetical protein